VEIVPECTATLSEKDVEGAKKQFMEIDCKKFTYNVLVVGRIEILDLKEESKIPVFNGEEVAFSSPKLVFVVRVEKSLDEHVEVKEIGDNYDFEILLEEPKISESFHVIALLQEDEELDWAVEFLDGTVSSTGSIKFGIMSIEGVPLLIGLDAFSLNFEGELLGESITGDVSGTSAAGEDVKGTFKASPASG